MHRLRAIPATLAKTAYRITVFDDSTDIQGESPHQKAQMESHRCSTPISGYGPFPPSLPRPTIGLGSSLMAVSPTANLPTRKHQ